MRATRTIAASLLGLFCLPALACAPAASPAGGATATATVQAGADSRVAALLRSRNVPYEIDDQGDYKIVEELREGRTQLVFVNSNTEKYGPYETREVWAAAYRTERPFSAETANLLLTDSYKKILGGWQTIVGSDGRHIAVFAMKIPADADADYLVACIENVSHVADDMELRLTGKDDL